MEFTLKGEVSTALDDYKKGNDAYKDMQVSGDFDEFIQAPSSDMEVVAFAIQDGIDLNSQEEVYSTFNIDFNKVGVFLTKK